MTPSEMYEENKRKYQDAYERRRNSYKQEEGYVSQRNKKQNELSNCKRQKSDKEKRLKEVNEIIGILEGTGSWFSADVPSAISKAKKALNHLDSSYRKSIVLTGGSATANMNEAFEVKTVTQQVNSETALNQYKNVGRKLESELETLKSTISNLESSISTLKGKIRTCNSTQSSLTKKMQQYAYNMTYWKKRM